VNINPRENNDMRRKPVAERKANLRGEEHLRFWPKLTRRNSIAVFGLVATLALTSTNSWGADRTKIKIGIIPTLSAAPIVLGIQKGFFASEGLDATVETVQSAAAAVPALLNGEFQFLESASAPTIAALSNKLPVKVVGNETTMNDAQAILLVAADGPKTLAELAGKTVAVNALRAFLQLANQAAIDKAGGDSSKVKFVELPFSDMIGALKAGRVDAITVPEPLSTIGQAQGLRVLSQVWQAMPKDAAAGWQLATASYAKANPDVIKKFQSALRRSVTYASQHPDEVRAIVATYMKVDATILGKVVLPDYVPDVSVTATEALVKLMRQYGYIRGDLPDGWLIP
jgi:NitT/TauT family transport system substrate-binding protein